jgi:hypothetical protein
MYKQGVAYQRGSGLRFSLLQTSWRLFAVVRAVVAASEQILRQKLSSVLLAELWWVERCPLREGAAGPWPFRESRSPPHGSFQSASSSSGASPPPPSTPFQHAHLVYYRQHVTARGADDPSGSRPVVRQCAVVRRQYGIANKHAVGGYCSPSQWSWYVAASVL